MTGGSICRRERGRKRERETHTQGDTHAHTYVERARECGQSHRERGRHTHTGRDTHTHIERECVSQSQGVKQSVRVKERTPLPLWSDVR